MSVEVLQSRVLDLDLGFGVEGLGVGVQGFGSELWVWGVQLILLVRVCGVRRWRVFCPLGLRGHQGGGRRSLTKDMSHFLGT